MDEVSDINVLVSNIVDQKHYSHCRLCLKGIQDDNFARLQDSVAYSAAEYLQLSEIIAKIFGKEVCMGIPGIDAICSTCLEKTLLTLKLIYQCEAATEKLHCILDSVNTALLCYDFDISNKDKVLYVVCGEKQSELIFVPNTKEVKKSAPKMPFKCFSCKQCFDLLDELKKHNINQHGQHTCDKCTFTSENEVDMVEHKLSTDLFKCKECPLFRCTETSLQDHEDSTHGVHMCQECGKSFRGLDKLLAHEERHDKNQCPKCAKVYTTKEFFAKHVKLCMEDKVDPHPMRSRYQKTYFCQECGKGYSTPGGLRVHARFVHENAEPHVCKQCGKKFTAPCYLKVHMVTHTKEKNFPCDMCTGKFVSKEALLYHKRRHTGEKPYSCDICNEKFVNSSARAEHIKHKHIGPTLSCELCSRKFVTKNFLRLHMKKHHDPTNKLYIGRSNIPPNVPGEQNMRVRILRR